MDISSSSQLSEVVYIRKMIISFLETLEEIYGFRTTESQE